MFHIPTLNVGIGGGVYFSLLLCIELYQICIYGCFILWN